MPRFPDSGVTVSLCPDLPPVSQLLPSSVCIKDIFVKLSGSGGQTSQRGVSGLAQEI